MNGIFQQTTSNQGQATFFFFLRPSLRAATAGSSEQRCEMAIEKTSEHEGWETESHGPAHASILPI